MNTTEQKTFDLPLRTADRAYHGLPLLDLVAPRPALGQLFLPQNRYRLSAEAGAIVAEYLNPSGPSDAPCRTVARTIAALLARACKGPQTLRRLVAAGDVQGLTRYLSRPRRQTNLVQLHTLNDATWLLE